MLPPKSHHIDTEYRRSFKKSRFTCSASTYQDNLDFRTEQKRRFVVHNPEPFAWDPEDLESDSGSDQNCEDLGRSNRLTHTQYKHEKLNRLYEKRMNGSKEVARKSNGAGEVQTVSTRDASRRRESGEEREREREEEREDDRVETDEEEYEDSGSESDASVVHIIEPEFVKEPAKRTSSARPVANKQTQTDRSRKHQLEKKLSLAPFAPYGYEANVMETGKKLTHNIRAARDIYPSALRALKNRKTTTPTGQQIPSRGKHGQPSARLTTSEPVRIFVHSDDFDDPDWVTEYDRNFQLYDPNEYRKRPDSARVHARELLPQVSGKTRRQTQR